MTAASTHPLNELPAGRRAHVLLLRGGREFQHRALSMGLSIGAEVEVLQRGAEGDPDGAIAIRSGDTRLILGHNMAHKILVRPVL